MMLKIFQTVLETPPQGVTFSVPIFSKRKTNAYGKVISEPWLGDGFYFWESSIENAEYWGRTHCCGKYKIYVGEYDSNDIKCLNLVDNYECICFVAQAFKTFEDVKKRKPKLFCQVIYFLREQQSFRDSYDFARVPADGGMQNGEEILFDQRSRSRYFLVRQIQVCFWQKRSEIVRLTEYVKDVAEQPVENDEWLV